MYNMNFNSSSASYLLNYDLISKYNLTSLYACPKIHKVKFQVSLKNFLVSSNFQNKNDFNLNIQLKSILFFYLIFSIVPYINFYSFKNIRSSKFKENGDFVVELTLTDKKVIDSFIFNLWLESKEILSFSKCFDNLIYNQTYKNWSYNVKILGTVFKNVDDYFNFISKDVDLHKLQVNLCLVFSNFIYGNSLSNLIKNVSILK